MLFTFIGQDNQHSLALRKQHRPAHLARLADLQDTGRLIIAGPLLKTAADSLDQSEFSGSLIIAEFDSFSDAQNWAKEEPYMIAGVFKHFEVKPFKQVLP